MTPAQQHAPTWIGMPTPDTYACLCPTDPAAPATDGPDAAAGPVALMGAATQPFTRAPEHDERQPWPRPLDADAWTCEAGHIIRVATHSRPIACPVCDHGMAQQATLVEEAEAPPTPGDNRRTLEALIRAVITARALVTQATPYDTALLALARALRREHILASTDQAIANTYVDAPVAFLADLDTMTPAQQARLSLRVARAWGLDISQVDQLWVESRARLVALGMPN